MSINSKKLIVCFLLISGLFRGCEMGELNRGERLQIMLMPEELRIIDTWRFAKRMPSRAAAIRELLKRGMAVEGFGDVQDGQRSKDFSVLPDQASD
jgi:hypothetical protein